GRGLSELLQAIDRALADPPSARPGWRWSPDTSALREDVDSVTEVLPADWTRGDVHRGRALALWALLSLDEHDELRGVPACVRARVAERRADALERGRHIDNEVIHGRYSWIDARTSALVRSDVDQARRSITDRVDGVLLDPVFGFLAFLVAMGVVFQSLFSWADPAIGWIEALFSWLSGV